MPLTFDLKVVPSSGRNAWKLDKSGLLKCYLKSPAQKGLANKELVKLLAKALGLPQSNVAIVSGASSRKKRVRVEVSLSFHEILAALGVELQKNLFE